MLSLVLSATACLQEPTLYLNMCFCAASGCICLQEPVMYMLGSVDKSFRAVPGRLGMVCKVNSIVITLMLKINEIKQMKP